MADIDVFGILSLLLAAAGAAYLVWTRVLRSGAAHGARDPSGEPLDDRAAETMPPALRPESEIPPNMLARAKAASARPAPPSESSAVPDGASATNEPLPIEPAKVDASKSEPVKSDAPKREVAKVDAPKREVAKVDAPKHGPAKADASKREVAKADASKGEAVKADASKREAVKADASKREAAKADVPKSESRPASTATVAGAASASKVPPAAKAAQSVSSSASAPAKRTSDPDVRSELPRIEASSSDVLAVVDLSELPEVEPIQPGVEKIVIDEGADTAGTGGTAPRLAVRVFAQSVPGKRKKRNEDSLLVLEKESVFLVADGMGADGTGEIASKLVVKMIGDAFARRRFDAAAHEDIPIPASELARSIQTANAAVFHAAKKRPELRGMGSTVCAAHFTEDMERMFVGHVGDSRCYRIRDGVMRQLTTDHTMSDYGVAGPEGAHLSRALGVWPAVSVDVIMAAPALGDVYLLCSDGLTKVIPDGTIAAQLLHEEDPRAAVVRLVFFANAHGSKDDVTIVLLRIVEAGRPSSRPT